VPALDFIPEAGTNYSSGSFSHPSKRNLALSYFLGLNADESSPSTMLAGDRNLDRDPKRSDQDPGRNYLKGEQRLGSTEAEVKDLRWNDDIHQRGGNVAFMDGSVQQLTSGKLRNALTNSADKANRIWLPQ
jgi:prepilin-type processing-associated H-X9-DG protein